VSVLITLGFLLAGQTCLAAASGANGYDFGDAPDDANVPPYPTLLVHEGARHAVGGPWFGDEKDRPDAEKDGQPDPNALGDDADLNDDEGGITIPPLYPGQPAVITLDIQGGGGIVQAWIDFDANGVWQPEENIFDGLLPEGPQTMVFTVPEDAVAGVTYARFRISTGGRLEPKGPAADGEVEDHAVLIEEADPSFAWRQWPDVTQSGIDIRVDPNDGQTRWLADDFHSISNDSISHIRLWGSWKEDRQGIIKNIHVAVYANDPNGAGGSDPDNRYARPDIVEPLWQSDFDPNQFRQKLFHVVRGPGKWWWDPVVGEPLPGADTQIWQIDISTCSKALSGSPENPVIYWLGVRMDTEGGEFAWQTRQWPYHDLAGAVWDAGTEPPRVWKELRCPELHPYHQLDPNAVDLAFLLQYQCCTPTCQTCVGPTCGPTCNGPTCPGRVTCDGLTSFPRVTCGPTCNGPTCPGRVTCDGPTCFPRVTCGATCNGPTCPGRATCGGVTCGPTCDGPTCPGRVTCDGATCYPRVTCSGLTCSPTCGPTICTPTACGGTTCGGTCTPTCLTCPTRCATCVTCQTCSTCVTSCATCRYTCFCPFPRSNNAMMNVPAQRSYSAQPTASAACPVVYTLQKDWLITDYTCPALQVDCPAVVPETARTSGQDTRAQEPRASRQTADERTSAGG
jgi:hypothetical protein